MSTNWGGGATLTPVRVESRDNSRQRNSAIPYEDDASTSNAGPERVDLTADLTVRRLQRTASVLPRPPRTVKQNYTWEDSAEFYCKLCPYKYAVNETVR